MPSGHFREYILHLTMASRWLHDIVKPSHTIRINIVCKTTTSCIVRDASGIIVCPSCIHRVPIGRLRTCFGSTLAFYQIRDENRAKLKNSYSCGHRVSKSARYDATLNEHPVKLYLNKETQQILWLLKHALLCKSLV